MCLLVYSCNCLYNLSESIFAFVSLSHFCTSFILGLTKVISFDLYNRLLARCLKFTWATWKISWVWMSVAIITVLGRQKREDQVQACLGYVKFYVSKSKLNQTISPTAKEQQNKLKNWDLITWYSQIMEPAIQEQNHCLAVKESHNTKGWRDCPQRQSGKHTSAGFLLSIKKDWKIFKKTSDCLESMPSMFVN